MVMDKATKDLFDAPLGDAFDSYQELPDQQRFPSYRCEYSVDPKNWTRYIPPIWAFALTWKEYRYADVTSSRELNRLITVDYPGVYIFYASPHPTPLIHHFPRFPFYIGISNENGSLRPLRERLSDYLPKRLASIQKRKNFHRMVQQYYPTLRVAFAVTKDHASDLESLEQCLHGYIYPIFDRRDFPVDVKDQQRAWGKV